MHLPCGGADFGQLLATELRLPFPPALEALNARRCAIVHLPDSMHARLLVNNSDWLLIIIICFKNQQLVKKNTLKITF